MKILTLMLLAFTTLQTQPIADVYSVWAEPGLHLMMCDNGTPDDYDDDWVVDWEYNRDVMVLVLDK